MLVAMMVWRTERQKKKSQKKQEGGNMEQHRYLKDFILTLCVTGGCGRSVCLYLDVGNKIKEETKNKHTLPPNECINELPEHNSSSFLP